MRLLPCAIVLISLLIGACFAAQLDDDKFDSDFDSDWFWIGSNLRSISKSTKCNIHIFTAHLNIHNIGPFHLLYNSISELDGNTVTPHLENLGDSIELVVYKGHYMSHNN